jgi:hypothetical protein
MTTLKTWVAAATMVALSGAAQAALIDRGGGMIYDTTRNITWLADMNYALTSGHTGTGVNATNGRMTWDAATAWANNLVYGGFDDWRLPTPNPADTTGGELSGLFVTDLGNKANESVLNQLGDTAEQIANLALFSNVQSYAYWSGTEHAPNPAFAWDFRTFDGSQGFDHKSGALYAVAVRPGDVVTASVPEPQTLALALLALGATGAASRRRPL